MEKCLGLCNGDICKKIKWTARTTTNSGNNKVAEMWTASSLYNTLFWLPLGKKNTYAQAAWGNSSQDNAPGGLFGELFSDNYETHATFLAKEMIYLITGDKPNFNINLNNFTMMPSFSSADLRFANKNLYMKWDDQYLCGKTPFDYIYAPLTNEEHVFVSPQGSVYFENEARCAVANLPVFIDKNINGDTTMCNTATYSLVSCKPLNASNISWTVTPSGIATITGTGNTVTLNRNGSANGIVTLTANLSAGCGDAQSVSKQITIGTLITGYYFVSSNYSQPTQRPLGPNNAAIFLPANQSFGVDVYITGNNLSSYSWTRAASSYPFSWGFGSGRLFFSGTSGTTAYSQRNGTFTISAQGACGAATQTFNWPVIVQGWGRMSIKVSPNPVNDNLNIAFSEQTDYETTSKQQGEELKSVRSIKSTGKTIVTLFELNTTLQVRQWIQDETNSKGYNYKVAGLRKGLYILQVDRNNQTATTKIIVE